MLTMILRFYIDYDVNRIYIFQMMSFFNPHNDEKQKIVRDVEKKT